MKSGAALLDEIRNNCGAGEFSLVDVSVAAEMRETIRAAGVAGATDSCPLQRRDDVDKVVSLLRLPLLPHVLFG
jgi:hypothetical protein